MAAVPEFARVKLCLLLEPIATFPKFTLLGVTARFPEDEVQPDRVRAANNGVANSRKILR
jgi:hypothetical protein